MAQHARQSCQVCIPLVSSLLYLLLLPVQIIRLLGNGEHALLVILLCGITQSTLHTRDAFHTDERNNEHKSQVVVCVWEGGGGQLRDDGDYTAG